ncbi:MAG TPA: hypothetical protein VM243_08700 [Phycisphaerae bacterium]|nr:hypothetical protein [Phycisphaerae bacterium]
MPGAVRLRTAKLIVFTGIAIVCSASGLNPALAQCEVAKLLAADGAAGDAFGFAVGVSADTALIGAYGDNASGDESGSAYIFHFDGTSWVEQQKLLASDGAASDRFGYAVGVASDTALIGAYGDDANTGSAYVFRFDRSMWGEQAKLVASDGEPGDHFGVSVALSGDAVVLGAPFDGDNGPAAGAAYVFRYNGASWVEEQKLLASGGAPWDLLGVAVAISGDTAVIGAPWDEDNGWRSGSAYVFRFDGSTWVQQPKLLASDGAGGDCFGAAVALSGDTAVIGAPTDQHDGWPLGSAYIFRFDGWTWVEQAKLVAPDAEWGDEFGVRVAIEGDTAVIGLGRIDESGERWGGAYVFRYDGSSWPQVARVLASDGEGGDHFGRSVAIAGDTAVVGAYGDGDNGPDSGSACVFDLDPIPGDLDCDGCVDQADLGILLADWQCTGGECPGDCDGDGDTDQSDLGILLAHWGQGCP